MSNFWDDGTRDFYSEYPSSVKSALIFMNNSEYCQMTSDLCLDSIDSVISKIKETNHLRIVDDDDDAFEVWIDPEGKYSIKVYYGRL